MSDLIFFSFADGKRLFKRHRRLLLKTSFFSFLFIFTLLLFHQPKFRAEASFRQTSVKTEKDLKGLFKHLQLRNEESEAISLMQSYSLLQKVVQDLGLQAQVMHSGLFSRALNNLTRELGGMIEKEEFYFRNFLFLKEKKESFYLVFFDQKQFKLLDAKEDLLCQGTVGHEVRIPELVFTLEKIPSQIRYGRKYPLKVTPLRETAVTLLKALQIKISKVSPQLLHLTFDHSDRKMAVKILNHLMQEYQNFLFQEHEEVAEQQLDYLEKRQNQLSAQLKENWKSYSAFLQKSLKEQGILGLSKHLEQTALPLENEYLQRLAEIAVEKSRFETQEQVESTQRIASKMTLTSDFRSVNNIAAKELHGKYSEEYERLRVRIRQLSHLLHQMGDPDFELSSLSSMLTDSISQEMIRKASDLSLILCDENNHSPKERERTKESIQIQRRFLQQHLLETIELEKMRLKLLGEKISSLATSALDLIRNEEHILQRQLKQFREQIALFPERWLLENELKFKKRLSMNVIDVITQLNESKVIQQLLFQVESKPLDLAFAPLKSKYPFLCLFSLAAAFLSLLGVFLILLFKMLCRGIPLTAENASAYQVPSIGNLSEYSDISFEQLSVNDLETLRRATFSLKECSGIILGKGPDYSRQIARLLALQDKRVLLIEAGFDKSSEQSGGLSQYLLGHATTYTIRNEKFYDLLSSGGPTAHGAELFSSSRFFSLLSELKNHYDSILIVSCASPNSSEAHALLKTIGSGIVTLKEETYKEIASLLPFSINCIFYE